MRAQGMAGELPRPKETGFFAHLDKTFRTKREASAWAAARETELRHL